MNDGDDSEHSLQCSPVSEMANYVAKTLRTKRHTLNTLHLDNCSQLPFPIPEYRNTTLLLVIPLCDFVVETYHNPTCVFLLHFQPLSFHDKWTMHTGLKIKQLLSLPFTGIS